MNLKKRHYNSGFTLLELLAVMLIMFMLMGLGTVAMKGLVQGSGISGAYSNVKSVLTQARQYAITKEQVVYVVFDKSDDGEKSSMTVCAVYGVCGQNESPDGDGGYYFKLQSPLPWGTNTLVGGKVYNLDYKFDEVESAEISDHPKIDRIHTNSNLNWSVGNKVGFEVADVRYLPSGMEFDGDDLPTVIFRPNGSAYKKETITFKEMYIANATEHTLTVDKLTGWVKVK